MYYYKRLFFVIFGDGFNWLSLFISYCWKCIRFRAWHQGCHMSKGEVSNALIDECEDCLLLHDHHHGVMINEPDSEQQGIITNLIQAKTRECDAASIAI